MEQVAKRLLRLQLGSLVFPFAAGVLLATCRNPPKEHEALVWIGILMMLVPWLYFAVIHFPAEVKRAASKMDLITDPRLLAWIRTIGLMAFIGLGFFGEGDRGSYFHTVRFGFMAAGAFMGFHLLLLRALLESAQSHRNEYQRGREDAQKELASIPVSK